MTENERERVAQTVSSGAEPLADDSSSHLSDLIIGKKLPNGDFVQAWAGKMYDTLHAPWAQRRIGVYGWGYRIRVGFDGTPKINTRERAIEVALMLAKVLEGLPDWTRTGDL